MGRVSQHHFSYRRKQYGFGDQDDLEFFNWRKSDLVTIENDVWIGHGATITAGTHVGTGSVIGAGAVVTHDVQPYEIVGGVPAKRIRWRFPGEMIEKLLAIAWWDWDHSVIEERFKDFLNLDSFLEKYA
jgi:acetyltransferase-like isoleucine patch superfamily enzyme